MSEPIPDEVMREARKTLEPLSSLDRAKIGHVNIDAVVHRVARALLARDKRVAEIARRKAERLRTNEMYPAYGLNSQVEALEDIATTIETYGADNGQ